MQEWYLMKSPTLTSGDESDLLRQYSEDALTELLNSDVADDVELYDSDLTFVKKTRALVIDKMQETKLKSLRRQIALPIGTCTAGQYIKYKDRFWLIVGLVDNDITHEKGVMVLCNYLLTWINSYGKIVQRWANITSASQYNSGETGQQFYNVQSDQLMVSVPDDDECLLFEKGIRFIIDKRCKVYEKNFPAGTVSDTSKDVNVYSLTRLDAVLYDYQDSGYMQFIAYQDEQRLPTDGYYVVDGKGYWLCKKPRHTDTPLLTCDIEADFDCLYCGIEATEFVAKFYDENGGEAIATPNWEVACDFLDDLIIGYTQNSILIYTDKKRLVGKSFTLTLSADGYAPTSIIVSISPLL